MSAPRTDLRGGGQWSRAQRAKNDALWALARVTLALTRLLSDGVLTRLGGGLGRLAYAVAGDARRTALANVARVFPELDVERRREFVRQSFLTLGRLLGKTVALLNAPGSVSLLPVAPEALALIEQARAEGRGVLFASAHLGPWEHVAASLVAAGVPLVTVARESYDPRFTRLYERLRQGTGVRVIWRERAGASARVLRSLREGSVLGLPMDLRARVPSCSAPFLGHDAPTAAGPARIALRARAAVIVGTIASGGRGSWLVTATRVPTGDLACTDAAARELTARINAELSRRILAIPHAWVWMHERWVEHGSKSHAMIP